MKNLVLVSGMHDVPNRFKHLVYVVNVNSWEEAILYLSGKKNDMGRFWGAGVPVERMLKSIEFYEGNLLVYSEAEVDPVMRSRFTRILRGKQAVRWVSIGKDIKYGGLLDSVKASMGIQA
jgi:hypothetical protein